MVSDNNNKNVYVGHRYVPKIFGVWDKLKTYEGLSIVTWEGTSYTSKKRVPEGVEILNEEYWVVTGNYNAQVENYRQEVRNMKDEVDSKVGQDEFEDSLDSINQELTHLEEVDVRLDTKIDDGLNTINQQLEKIAIDVTTFGAIGDGEHDDAPAIREAYNHLKAVGGGVLYFPMPTVRYSLQSVVNYLTKSVALPHDSDNITFRSPSDGATIRADVEMDSIIYVTARTDYTILDNVFLNANKLADFCFDTAEVYSPFMDVKNSRFYGAKEFAFRVKTYLSTFSKSFFGQSKHGLRIEGVGENIATSVTLDSCYAVSNEITGFSTRGLRYSTFNSCAVDNMENGIAYDIEGRGLSFNSCGAEKVRQIFKFQAFRGVSINTFFAFDVGSLSVGNPTQYLIEFVTGVDSTVNGFHIQEGVSRHYKYKLGLTSANYGFENITIVDNSIKRNDSYFVSNYTFNRPIKFIRGDETTKNETVKLTVDELRAHIDGLTSMEINHVYTIELADGTQLTSDTATTLSKLSGTGKIIIKGNSSDRTRVVLHGAYNRLFVNDCSVNVEFKDLTLNNRTASSSSHIFQCDNSRHVVLNNVSLNNNEMNTGSAVSAKNGAKVFLTNGTSLNGNTNYWIETVQSTFYADETSEIKGITG